MLLSPKGKDVILNLLTFRLVENTYYLKFDCHYYYKHHNNKIAPKLVEAIQNKI